MMRRSVILGPVFVAGLLLVVPAGGRANPLLLAPVMPGASDVLRLIDALTKSDSETEVNVKFGKTVTQGKLLVARVRADVVMERSSRNWRGRVVVQMKVPSEITYSVDLTQIRPHHVRADASGRLLIIRMPKLQVEDVTPALSSASSECLYKGVRFKLLDKATMRELENAMLLHDYQAKAREVGVENLGKMREQGRKAMALFMHKLLQGTSPGVRIVVE